MSWQQISEWIPATTGIFALAIGIFAVILPKKAAETFGIHANPESLPYVAVTGARDIFIGLITLVIYWHGNTQLIGANFICIAVVAAFDFFLTLKFGSRCHSAIHFAGAVFSLIYGLILIF